MVHFKAGHYIIFISTSEFDKKLSKFLTITIKLYKENYKKIRIFKTLVLIMLMYESEISALKKRTK